ncbi:hypothetical protein [Bacillus sp. Brlt_9]|uniref:hypothetical protein n=1 Tax=Bacillus sp. Brlt_9 TaxID=3110916 RepID=UPI003F7CB7D4
METVTSTDVIITSGISSGIITLILILSSLAYILTSLGLMTLAKNAGIKNPWLAWIPIANLWIWGELISEKLNGKGGKKVLLITLAYAVTQIIPFINILTAIAYAIFAIMLSYWLFKKYTEKPVLHTILSILIPIYSPILLFVIRNNEAK